MAQRSVAFVESKELIYSRWQLCSETIAGSSSCHRSPCDHIAALAFHCPVDSQGFLGSGHFHPNARGTGGQALYYL